MACKSNEIEIGNIKKRLNFFREKRKCDFRLNNNIFSFGVPARDS